MDVRRAIPHPALRSVVRSFGERRGSLGSTELSWPLTARPHQIIDIYLADPLRIRVEGGPLKVSPETVVVGPQGSRRATGQWREPGCRLPTDRVFETRTASCTSIVRRHCRW